MNEKYLSALVLEHTVFDCVEFHRKGFRNSNEVQMNLQVVAGNNDKLGLYKVTLTLEGEKADEYSFKISISGFFSVNDECLPEGIQEEMLLKNNAVAILMPYLRSEVSLVTSQPETECVVMPVLNISALLNDNN